MLPSQFNPLNSFGIDGDIFISYVRPDGNLYKMRFYNTNPNKQYDYIEFPYNFGGSIKTLYNWPDAHYNKSYFDFSEVKVINFYNFNQEYLSLLITNPIGFLANAYFFDGFISDFDGYNLAGGNYKTAIKLIFRAGTYCLDYMFCLDADEPADYTDYTNVVIDFIQIYKGTKTYYTENLGSEATARYMFYGVHALAPNTGRAFKDIIIPFLYFDDLRYCFACPHFMNYVWDIWNFTLSDYIKTKEYLKNNYEDKLGFTPGDSSIRYIDYMIDGYVLPSDYYTNNPNGFIGTDLSFPKLESAAGAFKRLDFKEIDIENLLNAIPTKTDGKEHLIGMGADRNITEAQINEYVNRYNQKGWTANISYAGW